MRVLRASGVQSEAHLPFSGLHQLLRPILDGADDLPAPQRAALLAAFGMSEEAAPDRFLIALAVLDLVADAATAAPAPAAVEDGHWLDPSSAEVLAFVARRLSSDPIVLLAAVRDRLRHAVRGRRAARAAPRAARRRGGRGAARRARAGLAPAIARARARRRGRQPARAGRAAARRGGARRRRAAPGLAAADHPARAGVRGARCRAADRHAHAAARGRARRRRRARRGAGGGGARLRRASRCSRT